MAAYTGRSRSAEAGLMPTCVSVTIANRKLIRHANRHRPGYARLRTRRDAARHRGRRPSCGAGRAPAPVRRTGHRRRAVAAVPGIGQPGLDRIGLFTGSRAVLALDANALRVLSRLGYGHPARSYAASYRQAQAEACTRLPGTVPALQRAAQLLRRHGQTVCRRRDPACSTCVIAGDCPSAGHPPPLY